ncbi:MAG: DUF2442 domain-containing protein [Nitrospirota bacterium]
MKSARLGKRTSPVEVTNVSEHGFWLLIEERERFIEFDNFPWFKEASIFELCQVELQSPQHLYWPSLDIDLAVESLEYPERFPLMSKKKPNQALQRTRSARR